jgi:hypothetical protein
MNVIITPGRLSKLARCRAGAWTALMGTTCRKKSRIWRGATCTVSRVNRQGVWHACRSGSTSPSAVRIVGEPPSRRREIGDLLYESPGLKSRLPELYLKAYTAAIDLACEETNLDMSSFSTACPRTFEQATSDELWPDSLNRALRKTNNYSRTRQKNRWR